MREDSLVFRLQRGDKSALEEIYKKYRTVFINWITFAHRCTHDEAIDIFQYSIISFYENVVDGVVEEMNDVGIKTYLFSIGKNKLLSDSRKQSKISYQDEIEDFEDERVNTANEIKTEKNYFSEKILSELGEPCSEILRLFYFNNLSNDEIAEVMNYKNGNTVKNLKYKCIQRIKKTISTDEKQKSN